MQKYTIREIVMHNEPHLDEFACDFALTSKWGKRKYNGIQFAEVTVYSPGLYEDGRSEEDWMEEGKLFVGVRGGRYDDHPHRENPSECAFTKVLNDLDMMERDKGSWKWLARHVFDEDRRGSPHKDHFAKIIKNLNREYHPSGVRVLVRKVLGALRRYYHDMTDDPFDYEVGECLRLPFIVKALRHSLEPQQVTDIMTNIRRANRSAQASFMQAVDVCKGREHTEVYDVWNENLGRPLVLVAVRSDNRDISKAARWKKGLNADIVVHYTPDSHDADMVYISSSKRAGFEGIGLLAGRLRRLEAKVDESIPCNYDRQKLEDDGMLNTWYYHEEGGSIFAATPTHPYSPRTKLRRRVVLNCVFRFLETARFKPPSNGNE